MTVGQEAQLRVIQSSPRGIAVPALLSVYAPLPGASPFISRVRARKSAWDARRDEGVETRDVG